MPVPDARPFVPDSVVWLASTTWWRQFSDEEKITANRLMGLLVNDLFLVIERDMIGPMLTSVGRDRRMRCHPSLRRALLGFADEERRHVRWFAAFSAGHAARHAAGHAARHAAGNTSVNRRSACAVLSYPRWLSVVSRCAGRTPCWRLWWWAVLITEEWTTIFAAQVAQAHGGNSGPIDAVYAQLHATHLRHERRHVAIGNALAPLWRKAPPWVLSLSARFSTAMVRQLLVPRRSITRMIALFVQAHPRWAEKSATMVEACLHIGSDAAYWRQVLPMKDAPVAARVRQTQAAFRALPAPIPGWST